MFTHIAGIDTKVIIVMAFVAYYVVRSYVCSCKLPAVNRPESCQRLEVMGLSLTHFLFYTLLGFLYPNEFVFWQLMGVSWEVFETLPNRYPQLLNVMGDCSRRPVGYVHPFDRMVGGACDSNEGHSDNHQWHVKPTDVMMNIVGFVVGAGVRLSLN